MIIRLNIYHGRKSKHINAIIAVDATKSMHNHIEVLRNYLSEAIQGSIDAIKESKTECSFKMQVIFYRNYNSKKLILEKSVFTNDSHLLSDYVKGIKTSGGMGNEAIEVCLQDINKTQKVNPI